MGLYLRSILWDFLLCAVASSALAYTLCSGFYATQPFQDVTGILLTAGICTAVTAVLAASGYTTRLRVAGSIAIGVVMVAGIAACYAASSAAYPMEDVAGNYLYYAIIVCACPVLVYASSRTKALCVILLVVGVVLCAVVEYLYWYGHVIAFLAFFCAAGALLVYRGYFKSVMNSESEQFAFNSVAVSGLVFGAVVLACAAGLFFLVVAPLNPDHLEMKLITEHYRVDELEVRGIGSADAVQDDTLYSNLMGDDSVDSGDGSDNSDGEADWSDETTDGGEASDNFINGFGAALSFRFPDYTIWVVIGSILALIVASVLIKLALRRRKYRSMVALGNEESTQELFRFFVKRFKRLGIDEPGERTLEEYAVGNDASFAEFERGKPGPRFQELCAVHSANVYGKCPVSDGEKELFERFYGVFYTRARAYVGKLRYLRLFFLL